MHTTLTQEQERQIHSIIANSAKHIKAREIAALIGLNHRDVNSYLYSNLATYHQDEHYKWSIIEDDNAPGVVCTNATDHKIFKISILAGLNNKDGARIFSQEEFDQLADWSYGKTQSGKKPVDTHTTATGNVIECDSSYEKIFLEHLESHNLALELGGQSLNIGYQSPFRNYALYYPDTAIYTITHHIAIVEVQPSSFMSDHTIIEKYQSLARYCEERGFMYMMIDPVRKETFEQFRNMVVHKCVLDLFEELKKIRRRPNELIFGNEDVQRWFMERGRFAGLKRAEFDLQMKSMIVKLGWHNIRGTDFAVYEQPVKWIG